MDWDTFAEKASGDVTDGVSKGASASNDLKTFTKGMAVHTVDSHKRVLKSSITDHRSSIGKGTMNWDAWGKSMQKKLDQQSHENNTKIVQHAKETGQELPKDEQQAYADSAFKVIGFYEKMMGTLASSLAGVVDELVKDAVKEVEKALHKVEGWAGGAIHSITHFF